MDEFEGEGVGRDFDAVSVEGRDGRFVAIFIQLSGLIVLHEFFGVIFVLK